MSYAIAFGGTDELVSMPHNAAYDFERTDSFSVSVWARRTSSALGTLVHKDPSSAPFRGWFISMTNWVTFQMESTSVSNANQIRVDTQQSNFNDGAWHHIVATYAGTSLASGVKIYVDGLLKSVNVPFDTLPALTIKNSVALQWGGRGSLPYFIGDSDDLAIFNKVLTVGEVEQIYRFGVGKISNLVGYWPVDGAIHPTIPDGSVNNNAGTMTNMEAADIFTREQAAGESAAPVVTNIVPPPGELSRHGAVQFDVTDDFGFTAVLVHVAFPGMHTELIHDSVEFQSGYQASTRTEISGGFRYVVRRSGGWPRDPTFVAHAVDQDGNQNA